MKINKKQSRRCQFTFGKLDVMLTDQFEAARILAKAGAPIEVRGILNPEIITHAEMRIENHPDGSRTASWEKPINQNDAS